MEFSISLDKFRQNSTAVLCMIQVPFDRQNVQTHKRSFVRRKICRLRGFLPQRVLRICYECGQRKKGLYLWMH